MVLYHVLTKTIKYLMPIYQYDSHNYSIIPFTVTYINKFHKKFIALNLFDLLPNQNRIILYCYFNLIISFMAMSNYLSYFYITMHYIIAMEIFYCLKGLIKKLVGLLYCWCYSIFYYSRLVMK